MLTIIIQSSIKLPVLVQSNTKGTIALVGSQNTNGTYNMTILKPGNNSTAFIGQYIGGTDLSGYSIMQNSVVLVAKREMPSYSY